MSATGGQNGGARMETNPFFLFLSSLYLVQAYAIVQKEIICLFTPFLMGLLSTHNKGSQFYKTEFLQSLLALFRTAFSCCRSRRSKHDIDKLIRKIPLFAELEELMNAAGKLRPTECQTRRHNLDTILLTLFENTDHEQLTSPLDDDVYWRRSPPPYVRCIDIVLSYDEHAIAPPTLLPVLNIMYPPQELSKDAEPWEGAELLRTQDCVHLVLCQETLPEDFDPTNWLELGKREVDLSKLSSMKSGAINPANWHEVWELDASIAEEKQQERVWDVSKKMHVIGGRLKRILCVDKILLRETWFQYKFC